MDAGHRGYAAIGLDRPKFDGNVGGVLRAAWLFRAGLVVVARARFRVETEDTKRGHLDIPVLQVDDLFDAVPYDCVPVAVERAPEAVPLPEYRHPDRAYYLFGGEDQTLGRPVLERCRDVVMIQARDALNLAACVNVVLYDRAAKRGARD